MKIIRRTFRIFFVFVFTVGVSAQGASMPAKPAPDYTAIAASTMMGDPNTYKAAYLVLKRQGAEEFIQSYGRFRENPKLAEEFRQSEREKALAYVNGDSFSPYVVAMIKDGLALSGNAAMRGYFPSNTFNAGLDDFIARNKKNGITPSLDAEYTFAATQWLLNAARDGKNPDHAWAAEQVQKYLKVDPGVNYAFLPQVQQKIEMKEIRDLLDQLKQMMADNKGETAEEKEELKRLKVMASKIMGQLQQQAISAKQEMQDKSDRLSEAERQKKMARAKEISDSLDDLSKGFGAAAGIAQLCHDPEAARFFQNAQALSQQFAQLVALAATKTFSENPGAYCNIYVAIVLLIINMVQESKKQDAMEVIYEQLVQISKQVEQLRQEMHQRLDMLEYKTDTYFRLAFFDIQNIQASSVRIEKMATQLINEIEEGNAEIKSGLNQIMLGNLTYWQTECNSTTPDGRLIKRDRQKIQSCRNQFAQLATGAWEVPLVNPLPNSDRLRAFGEATDHEYIFLKNTLGKLDPEQAWNQGRVNPFNFILGSQQFLKLFKSNPGYAAYIPDSNIGRDDLSLQSIVKLGNQTASNLNNLVLKQNGNKFELKKDLLLKLIDMYSTESINAITLGTEKSNQFRTSGPRPFLGAKDPIDMTANYEFFLKKIDWCDPKTAGVTWDPSPSHFYDTWNGNKPYYDPKYLPVYRESLGYNKEWFAWNKTFLPILPPAMVWASHMGPYAENLEITPCFRAISMPYSVWTTKSTHLAFHVELEFRGTINHDPQDFLIGKAVLDDDYQYPFGIGGVPVPGNYQPMMQNFWEGQKCPNRCDFNWPAVVKNGAAHFKPVELKENELDPRFKAYRDRLEATWANNAKHAEDSLKNEIASDRDVNAKRLLFLLANMGLDPSVPAAEEFIKWLAYPDSLPSRQDYAMAALQTDMTWNQIKAIVDAKVAVARQQIEILAKSQDLQPRAKDLDETVRELSRLSAKGLRRQQ